DALPLKPAGVPEVAIGDPRFRALLREEEWAALPAAVRRRFSKRLANGASTVYAGEVLETWMSRRGWLIAQLLRLIGGPLPAARRRYGGGGGGGCPARRPGGGGGGWGPASTGGTAASRRSCIPASASQGRPGSRNMSATASE